MYYEVKSKISSTLSQLSVNCVNQTKRTATKFDGLEKKRKKFEQFKYKFYWLSSSAL